MRLDRRSLSLSRAMPLPTPMYQSPAARCQSATRQQQYRKSVEGMAVGAASMAVTRTGIVDHRRGGPPGQRALEGRQQRREHVNAMRLTSAHSDPGRAVQEAYARPGHGYPQQGKGKRPAPGTKIQDKSQLASMKHGRSQSNNQSPTQVQKRKQQQQQVQNGSGAGAAANQIRRKPVGTSKPGGGGRNSNNGSEVLLELVKNAGMLSFSIMTRYYSHVRPVFDSRSKLRARFRAGRLTLPDGFLILLAGGFAVTLVLVGVVAFRVLVAFGVVFQFTAGLISMILGL